MVKVHGSSWQPPEPGAGENDFQQDQADAGKHPVGIQLAVLGVEPAFEAVFSNWSISAQTFSKVCVSRAL